MEAEIADEICFWESSDYDGDGAIEAFAATGSNPLEIGEGYYQNCDLWYIDGRNGVQVQILLSNVYAGDGEVITINERSFFLWQTIMLGGSSVPAGYLFGVDNNQGYEMLISGAYMFTFYPELGCLLGTADEYGASLHTYSDHVFELNDDMSQFVESDAVISREDNIVTLKDLDSDGGGVCASVEISYSEDETQIGYRNYYYPGLKPWKDEYYMSGRLMFWAEYEYDNGVFIRKRTYNENGSIIETSNDMDLESGIPRVAVDDSDY